MTDDELIAKYIEVDSWRGVSDAWVVGHGVQVWALVGALPASNNDIAEVADAYDLPLETMEAAMAFYRRHKAYTDARVLLNQPVFG